MEASRKMSSVFMGTAAALSRKPIASRYATRPMRATRTTAPGMRPRSTSARSVSPMRARRADDRPTSSGLARGSPSAPAVVTKSSGRTRAIRLAARVMAVSCVRGGWAAMPATITRRDMVGPKPMSPGERSPMTTPSLSQSELVRPSLDYPRLPYDRGLTQAAARWPENTAIVFKDISLTFRELEALANRFAHALRGLGIGRGDHVCLLTPNCPEFVVAFYGLVRVGAV